LKILKAVGWWVLYALISIGAWLTSFLFLAIVGAILYTDENGDLSAIYSIIMFGLPVIVSSLFTVAFSRWCPKKAPAACTECDQKATNADDLNLPAKNTAEEIVAEEQPIVAPVAVENNTALFCCACGAKFEGNGSFCAHCGTRRPSVGAEYSALQCSAQQQILQPEQAQCVHTCPRCGSHRLQYQTLSEENAAGCFTIFMYILLAITILGLLILIPLAMRKSSDTVTYEICQDCGHRRRVNA
jgi:predicted RNA-binding Zn-ribbon protein involved in translation (DUF1610 family)